jgi:hypothetical protein
MSIHYSIPLPGTSEHLDLEVGPFGGKKLTYQGRRVGSGWTASSKLDAGGKQFKITQRTSFAEALPRILIDDQVAQYFEPLPIGMTIIGVLTKIAMILGVINGIIFFIPGLLAFTLQQYLYRTMENKSLAVVIALITMALSWLIVLWGFYFWYNLIVG